MPATRILAALILSAAVGGAPRLATAAPEVEVQASNFRFCAASAPACLPGDTGATTTIAVKSVIRWFYNDAGCDVVVLCPGHNVTFKDGHGKTVKGSALPPYPTQSELYRRQFLKRGNYTYVCTIHQSFGMTGVVTVR